MDLSSLDVLHMQSTSCEIVLILFFQMEKGVKNGYVKFGCIAHAEYEL